MLLTIENDGPAIRATNYWASDYARRGAFYLSCNAGAFRLLVPPAHESVIAEFRTAREIVVSRGLYEGRDALEILFDDHTDSPFSLHMGSEQVDRMPATEDTKTVWAFTVWIKGKGGGGAVKAFEHACHYRVVATLPHLRPLGA